MTAAELDELERLLAKTHYTHELPWHNVDKEPHIVRDNDTNRFARFNNKHTASVAVAAVNALPALIAKVRAADALATRVDRALYDFGDDYPGRLDPVSDALDAYRKAGAE